MFLVTTLLGTAALAFGGGDGAAAPIPQPAQEEASWADVWKKIKEATGLYGDARLRFEGNYKLDDQPDRNRGRARFRIGTNIDVNEEFRVGARLVTGNPDDPNSPHVDLGDVMNKDNISFDRYFVTYSPCEGVDITGGKFAHGFATNPVYGEMVWDADVQPEGAAASYKWNALNFYAGYYVLVEQALASDASMFVAQVSGKGKVTEELEGTAALGWYDYGELTPDGNFALVGDNAGNLVIDTDADLVPDEYVSDFSVLNPFAALTFNGWQQPVTLAVEYSHNLDAEISEDSAEIAGIAVGKSKVKGDWQAYYQFAHVEQDSIFSAFAQDDFLLATNATNHVGGLRYRIDDKIELHLWGLVSSRDELSPGSATADSDTHQWRLRIDLNINL
jgi:hypothetical protein